MDITKKYLDAVNGDKFTAAALCARDLMRGDAATHKQGYTKENAALAVVDLFGLFARDYLVVEEILDRYSPARSYEYDEAPLPGDVIRHTNDGDVGVVIGIVNQPTDGLWLDVAFVNDGRTMVTAFEVILERRTVGTSVEDVRAKVREVTGA